MTPNLLKLLADNKRAVQSRIVAKDDEATVYLYDAIVPDKLTAEWMGGVCPQDLVPQIADIKAPVINVRINCPGGSVFAARAIATALEQHPAKVVAHIDGVAASAATAIACACDEVLIAEGAMYMIHNSMTFAFGNKADFLDTAALLEKVDGALAADYAERTKKPVKQITDWMDAETWFTAEEAVEQGFADRLAGGKKAKAEWNLSAYAKAPKAAPQTPEPITEEQRAIQRRMRLVRTRSQ